MKKRRISYILLALAMFCSLYIDFSPLRAWALGVLSFSSKEKKASLKEHIDWLELRCYFQKERIAFLEDVLKKESLLQEEIATYVSQDKLDLQRLFKQNAVVRRQVLSKRLSCVLARVVEMSDHVLWIDLGSNDNVGFVAENAPIVVGKRLLGLIDYVGKKRSRVRLITDPSIVPAVRALRECDGETLCLARGEMCGSQKTLWKPFEILLKGEGFHCGPGDDLSQARDLGGKDVPILAKGDFLVTTGMDGIFPPGLEVGIVEAIEPLQEGGYCYALWAKPLASPENLVQVLGCEMD